MSIKKYALVFYIIKYVLTTSEDGSELTLSKRQLKMVTTESLKVILLLWIYYYYCAFRLRLFAAMPIRIYQEDGAGGVVFPCYISLNERSYISYVLNI